MSRGFKTEELVAADVSFSVPPTNASIPGLTVRIRRNTNGLFLGHNHEDDIDPQTGRPLTGFVLFEQPDGRSVQVAAEISKLRSA